jgi:hypothetical protein
MRKSSSIANRLPILYGKMIALPASCIHITRLAESKFYRTKEYECYAFYKPISKFLLQKEVAMLFAKEVNRPENIDE